MPVSRYCLDPSNQLSKHLLNVGSPGCLVFTLLLKTNLCDLCFVQVGALLKVADRFHETVLSCRLLEHAHLVSRAIGIPLPSKSILCGDIVIVFYLQVSTALLKEGDTIVELISDAHMQGGLSTSVLSVDVSTSLNKHGQQLKMTVLCRDVNCGVAVCFILDIHYGGTGGDNLLHLVLLLPTNHGMQLHLCFLGIRQCGSIAGSSRSVRTSATHSASVEYCSLGNK
mmetsp:Transcript_7038/g.8070  ORF Transcript_7038/g.8070 Transcript_7038/m.8070 type:complete len:226 (+) Transcript_7038:737-1414(+)